MYEGFSSEMVFKKSLLANRSLLNDFFVQYFFLIAILHDSHGVFGQPLE